MAKSDGKSKGKGKGTHPSRANYWASGSLKRNKVRRIMKYNRVYVDAKIEGKGKKKAFVCPQCNRSGFTHTGRKTKAGSCEGCGYKLKTRPVTEAEARVIFAERKRQSKAA